MWNLPGSVDCNIDQLIQAASPVHTYVEALMTNTSTEEEKRLGKKRMKQLKKYETLFFATLRRKKEEQQEDAPQIKQIPGNNIMSIFHNNLYNSDNSPLYRQVLRCCNNQLHLH
jgi:hypothetical protein